jgi:hypothetical protein
MANKRSVKWYGTEKGRMSKKGQNNKRSKCYPGPKPGNNPGKGAVNPTSEVKRTKAKPVEKTERTGAAPEVMSLDIEHTNTRVKPEVTNTNSTPVDGKERYADPGDDNGVEKPTHDVDELPMCDDDAHSVESDLGFDEGMVDYLEMAISLIEGREVSRNEILELLTKTMRQRSLDTESRIEYILRNLRQNPP